MKSSLEIYRACEKILIFTSKIVGAEVWTPEKTLTPASYSIMIQMVIYFYSNFWTAYKYRHDMLHVMEVLNCTGIAVQLSVKFFIAVSRKTELFDLLQQLETELYKKYEKQTEPEGAVLHYYVRQYSLGLKLLCFLYCSSLVVFGLYPLYIYVFEGQLITLFMFEVPCVDWHSTTGYIVTNIVQVVTYVMGICGIILADGFFVLVVVHGLIYMEVFTIHMDQLDDLLRTQMDAKNKQNVQNLWRACLLEHQRITTYLGVVESFTGVFCITLVFTAVFSICVNIILVALTDWYASYAFLLVCFVQLTIYFYLGNLVELKVEALEMCIINFPYNLLDINNQKEYLFLVSRLQTPMILTVYRFAPLNFESYMTILKALYQFVMMIFNFVA